MKANQKTKQKWYKKTWFIVLMLVFVAPLGIFLMWKYAKWNKIVKVVVTLFSAFIFLTALFTSKEMNVQVYVGGVKSGRIITEQPNFELKGNVNLSDKDAVVTVNGAEVRREGEKFLTTIPLKAGENKVSIIATKDGERDEDRFVIVYTKPKPAAEKPKELTKKTEPKKTPVKKPTPSPPKPQPKPQVARPKTTMDRLWEASDKALGTREGVDIKFSEIVGTAQLFYTSNNFWNEKSTVGTAYADFVKWGQLIKDFPQVQAMDVQIKTEFTDARGGKSTDTAARVMMDTSIFKTYNWDNLKYQPIHTQLQNDGTLYIHPGIRSQINLNDVKLNF